MHARPTQPAQRNSTLATTAHVRKKGKKWSLTPVLACRPVRETDACEALCRERYAVHAATLPHVLRLAAALPAVHIDADGPLAHTRVHARAALAQHQAERRAQGVRREIFSARAAAARDGAACGWGSADRRAGGELWGVDRRAPAAW